MDKMLLEPHMSHLAAPLDTMTEAEKESYPKYLEQAIACGTPPGMGSARDSNSGQAINTANFLLAPRPKNTHSDKINAIYKSKQK
jgi:hypothetical protein